MEPSEILELVIECLRKVVTKTNTIEWEQEVAKLPEAERNKARLLATRLMNAKDALVNAQLADILVQLKKNEKELTDGTERVNNALKNLKEVKDVLDALSSLLSIVAEVATVAAAPSAAPFTAKMLKAAHSPSIAEELFLKAGSAEMLPESSAEEATVPLPLEEVLYKVELTPAKLVITVDAGLDRSVEVIFRNKLVS